MKASSATALAMMALVTWIGFSAAAQQDVATAGPATSSPAAAMPSPGKADSFELDKTLRRAKYPLQIKVIETAGKGGENVPVTLSVACGEGDYPSGKLCPMLGGKPLAAQVDVLATWPSDKSVKHALVTIMLPKIGPRETVAITFSATAPEASGKFVPAVDMRTFAARSEFDGKDGAKTVTAIDPATLARFADVLNGAISGDEAKKLAPRLAGPLCYEFEAKAPAKTGDAADNDIDVYYRLRLYSGVKGVRVEYDVENSRLPARPYPAKFTLADRDFTKLVFQAGPADRPETVYEQGAVTHWFGTRYRVCRWWGAQPVATFAKENAAYLIYSEFFPKIDLDHPLTAAEVDAQADKVTRAKWYSTPATCPDGLPLSNGPVTAYMGMTGGRADIGVYPLWDMLALATESPTLAYYARCADGNGLAAFPVHMRPGDTGAAGTPWDEPVRKMLYDLSMYTRANPITYIKSGDKGCPNRPDSGHVPSTSYYTYLATGEKFYEEELSFWAASQLHGQDGHLPGHDRYSAWPLRNATDAAFVLPDAHPLKKYFTDYVQRTVEFAANEAKDPQKYWTGRRTVSARKDWVCSGMVSMWQHCFYLWALDNAARKGWPVAATARDAAADLLLRLYEGKEEFKAPNGKVYRWSNPAIAVPYSLAVNLLRLDFSNPKALKETPLGNISDNTGAMYYYTMINTQYEFAGVKDVDKLVAKLPKKIMDPEDWALDPEVEKKFAAMSSNYTAEANGPTSAALARYDNPRAQKMYDFVRQWIDQRANPRRMRAIECVK